MSQAITLELPDDLVERAKTVAAHTGQPVEQVLVNWLNDKADDVPVDLLADDAILRLAQLTLADDRQAELDDLLARNAEGTLNANEQTRLDDILTAYRRDQVRKSQALRIANERGLDLS